MTGIELDKRMREVLTAATSETVLSSVAALVELGFNPQESYKIIIKVLLNRDRSAEPERSWCCDYEVYEDKKKFTCKACGATRYKHRDERTTR